MSDASLRPGAKGSERDKGSRRKSWLVSFRKKSTDRGEGDASAALKPTKGDEKSKFNYGAGDSISIRGGCHCGAVRFEATTPRIIRLIDCNCSFCSMKGNGYFMVPQRAFSLIKGEDMLTVYEFNTRTAKHLFCKVCGVQSFFRPRADPSSFAVYATCLDPVATPPTYIHEQFDGQSWKASTEIPNAQTQASI